MGLMMDVAGRVQGGECPIEMLDQLRPEKIHWTTAAAARATEDTAGQGGQTDDLPVRLDCNAVQLGKQALPTGCTPSSNGLVCRLRRES